MVWHTHTIEERTGHWTGHRIGGEKSGLSYTSYGIVWYGMVWHGMVYGIPKAQERLVWYGKVWYGMTWYDMVW